MHPELIQKLARQRQQEALAQSDASRRTAGEGSRAARSMRTRLGWLLVAAGSRLIVAELDTRPLA